MLLDSAVCTEWRSVAVENFRSRSLHQRHVPFLMIRSKDNMGNLHSLTQKKMYKFRFPVPDNMKCCGSSLGWLIMLDVTMDVILFNPFSGNTITFPPIRRLLFEKLCGLKYEDVHRQSALKRKRKRNEHDIRRRKEYEEEELDPGEMAFDLEDDHDEIQGSEEETDKDSVNCRIIKGVLSADPGVCPDNYVLMVIYGVEYRLAFIKSGDEDWPYIDNKTSGFEYLFKTRPRVKGFRYFEDILYWKNLFHAVDSRGKLLTCDINNNLRVKIVDVPKRGFGFEATSSSIPYQEHLAISSSTSFEELVVSLLDYAMLWSAFLVESVEGDLLWVPKFRLHFPTNNISVYQLADKSGNVGWVKKEDLGDAAIFLGDNHSISVVARDFRGCKPNSIYFLDKENETVSYYHGYLFDMGVCTLKRRPIARDYKLNPSERSMPPPIWTLPTFM